MSKSKNIQKQELKRKKKGIIITITILLAMISPIFNSNPAIATSTSTTDNEAPEIVQNQYYGEVLPGQELVFTITDTTGIWYVYDTLNVRETISNNGTITHNSTEVKGSPKTYEFKTKAPTTPGIYEFNICALDTNNLIGPWKCIPICVKESLQTDEDGNVVQDITPPSIDFYSHPGEYPLDKAVVAQGSKAAIRVSDNSSGILFVSYK